MRTFSSLLSSAFVLKLYEPVITREPSMTITLWCMLRGLPSRRTSSPAARKSHSSEPQSRPLVPRLIRFHHAADLHALPGALEKGRPQGIEGEGKRQEIDALLGAQDELFYSLCRAVVRGKPRLHPCAADHRLARRRVGQGEGAEQVLKKH